MSILFRYILKEFFIPATICFVGLSALFLLFTSFDLIGAFFDPAAHVTALSAFDFLAGTLSLYLEWLLPAVFLLSTLYTMWQFCHHSELIAMRANGISMLTIVLPILCVAVLAALLSFANTEFYKPQAAARANLIKNSDFSVSGREPLQGVGYASPNGDHAWVIGSYDPTVPEKLNDVRLTTFRPDGSMDQVYTANRAEWLDGTWWLLDQVKVTYYDELNNVIPAPKGALTDFSMKPIYCATETPNSIRIQNTSADLSSANDRRVYRKIRAQTGLTRQQKHEDSYITYNHYAAPISIILVTLFAIPAGIASGRQSVFKGILLALSLFLSYYVITALSMMLANHALIKPSIAVIIPSLIFGIAAAILFWRQR